MSTPRPQVALIDDSRVFLLAWRSALRADADLHFFDSPAAFRAAILGDPGLLARLDVVVTDYRFPASGETGVTLARSLRAQRPDLPICLSSSGLWPPGEFAGIVDVVLDKAALSWADLCHALAAARGP